MCELIYARNNELNWNLRTNQLRREIGIVAQIACARCKCICRKIMRETRFEQMVSKQNWKLSMNHVVKEVKIKFKFDNR